MNRQRGYSWPANRRDHDARRRDNTDLMQERRETALTRLIAWGDVDIAVILGLLPDDGSVA